MNPIQQITQYATQPPAIASFADYLLAVAWLLLPWLLLLWIVAVVTHIVLPASREHYGAAVAIRLSYAWAGFWVGAILALDVIVLLFLARVPTWSSVTPHATFIVVGLVFSVVLWSVLRAEFRASQVPVRKAQHGARA